MARDHNVADSTTNGGGEGSAVGNTLIYQVPSSPTLVICKLKKLIIDNASGAPGRCLFDLDSATTGTAMGAVADLAVEVGNNETVFLTEEDFGDVYISLGLMAQASNAAAGSGYKFRVEVDVLNPGSSF